MRISVTSISCLGTHFYEFELGVDYFISYGFTLPKWCNLLVAEYINRLEYQGSLHHW